MTRPFGSRPRTLVLTGGVGGAKLVLGLSLVLPPEDLTILANTSDDFEHLGLKICPDLDTVTYTLAGLANNDLGWGREGETWTFMSVLADLGGEDWFNLGDGDLALHVARTERLKSGESLSAITADICKKFAVAATILPMSDDIVSTIVETPTGPLSFQHYFVRDRCQPTVTGFRFDGLDQARANPELMSALAKNKVDAVIIAPSNPFVSVDPILGLTDLRAKLQTSAIPIVAVSPIVGGLAIKGPAAKMMQELGMPSTALSVARYYQENYPDLLSGFVIDNSDADMADDISGLGLRVLVTETVMTDLETRERLAKTCLDFVQELTASMTSTVTAT